MGSLPDRFALPNNRSATMLPSSSPGYHASSTASTRLSHGISTGPPVFRTTTVWLLAAATAEMSEFWLPDSDRLDRSVPSLSLLPTMTIATSALRAALAADVVLLPSLSVTVTLLPTWPWMPATGDTESRGDSANCPLWTAALVASP